MAWQAGLQRYLKLLATDAHELTPSAAEASAFARGYGGQEGGQADGSLKPYWETLITKISKLIFDL
jgi:hypothetical protein